MSWVKCIWLVQCRPRLQLHLIWWKMLQARRFIFLSFVHKSSACGSSFFLIISTYFYSIIHPTVGTCFICYIWCIHHVAIYIITNFFLSNLLCRCTKNCNSPDYLVFFFSAITLHTDGWLQYPLLTTFKLHINPMHLQENGKKRNFILKFVQIFIRFSVMQHVT